MGSAGAADRAAAFVEAKSNMAKFLWPCQMVTKWRPRKPVGIVARVSAATPGNPACRSAHAGYDLVRRAPPCPSPRFHGIEDRPVAAGQHMALRERRAQFDAERAQHAVVAVVALQDDAGEHGGGSTPTGAEFRHDSLALAFIERCQRLPGKLCDMIER